MFLHGRNYKNLLAVVLSTALALPAPSYAADGNPASTAKDGSEVFIEPIRTADGQTWYSIAALVDEKDEKAVAESVARNGENGTVMVSGLQDPVLQHVSGSKANVLVANEVEDLPLPAPYSQDTSFKKKLSQKIHRLTAILKGKGEANKKIRKGLFYALVNASAMFAVTYYASASVPRGLAVMSVSFAWAAFLMTSQSKWAKILRKAGEGTQWLAERYFSMWGTWGSKLTSVEARQFDLLGKFVASWVPNAAVAGVVFWGAGSLDVSTFAAALSQMLMFGAMLNYNIWDPVVDQKYHEGKISEAVRDHYVTAQVFGGTLLEASSYMGFTSSQTILVAATMSGVAYLAAQPEIEDKLIPRARMFKSDLITRGRKSCELALTAVKGVSELRVRQPAEIDGRRGYPQDDVQ